MVEPVAAENGCRVHCFGEVSVGFAVGDEFKGEEQPAATDVADDR